MRVLSLFSGGLDSILSIKVMQKAGFEVTALHFISYFFGKKDEKLKKFCIDNHIDLKYIDFKDKHLHMTKNPPNGYGKNMNPCIDCHALMLNEAGNLLEKLNASFIITGEVLGQRPMSQNKSALQRVEKLSGYEGLIVRPLSANLLPVTIPEQKEWIAKSMLHSIEGRGRKDQMSLANKFNIDDYPSPAGGCSLTDPNFSKRLKILKNDNLMDDYLLIEMIKNGRFLRFAKGKYAFIGRNEEENNILKSFKDRTEYYITCKNISGPDCIIYDNNLTDDHLKLIQYMIIRYSKNSDDQEKMLVINDKNTIVNLNDYNYEMINEKIKEFIVL